MSKRAEGCGQWLSAKEKRTTSHVARLPGGKAKKKKGLLKFASRGGQNGGLNIHISCSPLSPRTKKKLKNAKQSKIDNYFNGGLDQNGSTNDNKVATASKRAGSQEEKRTKIPIKRQREDSSSGYSTEDVLSNEQLMCTQEKEISGNTDLNISGISHLGDSFDNSDGLIENNLHQESRLDKNSDSMSSPIWTPPNKKMRTSRRDGTESDATEISKLLTVENEPTQSFHFSQWRRDQIAKCKKIQDENFSEDSRCSVASGLMSVEEESDLASYQGSAGEEFSETPPFQFTQWANKQVEVCRRIQKETDILGEVIHQSGNSDEHSVKLKLRSRERNSAQKFTSHSDAQFDFSESAKNQVRLWQNYAETEDTGSTDWESEKWGECIYKTGKTASTSPLSGESEFQFSEWMKSQLRHCRVIQEHNDEGL